MWAGVFGTRTNKRKNGNLNFDYSTNEELFIRYVSEYSDWDFVFTEEVNEWIERYNLHTQGIFSYSNIYDELPAQWIDVLNICNTELAQAQKSKEKQERAKRG